MDTKNASPVHFSHKCTTGPGCTPGIYLPDRAAYFSYF
jgi:hypothetical protein